jgi:biopolymer transport protein ExbD
MNFIPEDEDSFGLDLTPLIDVVFLLLVFFMVSTQFVDFSRRLDILLPRSYAGLVQPQVKRIFLEATRDGRLYLNSSEIKLQDLPQALAAIVPPQPTALAAIIRADRDIAYGFVVQLIDACKLAGIERVAVAVE